MSFFRKIFGIKSIENLNEDKEIVGFIYSTNIVSWGFNDPTEMVENTSGLILCPVYSSDKIELKFHFFNKILYHNLPNFLTLNSSQLDLISRKINLPPEKFKEFYNYWPKLFSNELYNYFFQKLNLSFIVFKPINPKLKNSYAIKINIEFWDINRGRGGEIVQVENKYYSNFLTFMIGPNERCFEEFELLHSNYEKAMFYGIIIMDMLCSNYGECFYYYEQVIKMQIPEFTNLPTFGLNLYISGEEYLKSKYEEIISLRKNDLLSVQEIFEKMKEKPFEIIKI